VRAAARSPALWISSISLRAGFRSSVLSRSSSLYPVITESRLLKSWATPPASLPTASIFMDWRSCSSLRCRASSDFLVSVMSAMIATMEETFPCGSRRGAPEKARMISDPSRPRQQISVLANFSPSSTRLHVAFSSRFPSEESRGLARPIVSDSPHPKMRTAAGFQTRTVPAASLTTTARGEASIRACRVPLVS